MQRLRSDGVKIGICLVTTSPHSGYDPALLFPITIRSYALLTRITWSIRLRLVAACGQVGLGRQKLRRPAATGLEKPPIRFF